MSRGFIGMSYDVVVTSTVRVWWVFYPFKLVPSPPRHNTNLHQAPAICCPVRNGHRDRFGRLTDRQTLTTDQRLFDRFISSRGRVKS